MEKTLTLSARRSRRRPGGAASPGRTRSPRLPKPYTLLYTLTLNPNPKAIGEIQCCSAKGQCTRKNKAGKCISGSWGDGDRKLYTYFEAKAACAKLGLRLCTKAETLSKGKVRVGVRVRVRVRVRCLRQPGATPVHQGRDTVQR